MTIEIHAPELERLMQEEIKRGNFQSVDELLLQALRALREKVSAEPRSIPASIMEMVSDTAENMDLPVWNLGAVGRFHRRDLYNDAH